FFSGRRRHTRSKRDWSSDVCSSDLQLRARGGLELAWDEEAELDAASIVETAAGFVAQAERARELEPARRAARGLAVAAELCPRRSEERRVGKEGSCQRAVAYENETE